MTQRLLPQYLSSTYWSFLVSCFLYLIKLDPIVSFTVYDIVKSIYASNNNLDDIRSRVSAIQNTLSQLRVTNIATLDALTQHFGRLIETTKADEEWISELSLNISYCTIQNLSH